MKIRFIQIAATDRMTFMEGKEYILPTPDAESFIRAGHAVEVPETPAPTEQPAERKRKQ